MEEKKIIFSGIQPTGVFTLGNYLGAIRNWKNLQNEYNSIFCVVDLHALTVRQVPKDLRHQTYQAYALLLACGIDPEKALVFVQSHVSGHTELSWILNNYTYFGELSRMTQFKVKSQKHEDNINAGLFDYPVLMAADILLYQANLVPIGADQKQHLELARDVADRFNNAYSPTFAVPEGYFGKSGARVKSLQEPTKKMSKSDTNDKGYILLLDSPNVIRKKFRSAVTDSDARVAYDPENKAGIANLMEIYQAITGESLEAIETKFEGQGYGAFKDAVADVVIGELEPIQKRFEELMSDKKGLEAIMKEHAEKASRMAVKTLRKVKKKIGLVQV